MPLSEDINLLKQNAEMAMASAKIADFFTVNESQIDLGVGDNVIVGPFCVAAMTVLKFEVALTFSDTRSGPSFSGRGALIALMINDEIVARAGAFEPETPSNASLFWRGLIGLDSEVKVVARTMDEDDVIIDPKELQWGYKLYGPEYALIENVDTTCLSV